MPRIIINLTDAEHAQVVEKRGGMTNREIFFKPLGITYKDRRHPKNR